MLGKHSRARDYRVDLTLLDATLDQALGARRSKAHDRSGTR